MQVLLVPPWARRLSSTPDVKFSEAQCEEKNEDTESEYLRAGMVVWPLVCCESWRHDCAFQGSLGGMIALSFAASAGSVPVARTGLQRCK